MESCDSLPFRDPALHHLWTPTQLTLGDVNGWNTKLVDTLLPDAQNLRQLLGSKQVLDATGGERLDEFERVHNQAALTDRAGAGSLSAPR